jgi:hypothetical protein
MRLLSRKREIEAAEQAKRDADARAHLEKRLAETRKDAIKKKVLGTDKQVSPQKYAPLHVTDDSMGIDDLSRATALWLRSSQPHTLPSSGSLSPVSTRTEYLNHQGIAQYQLPYLRTSSPGRNAKRWPMQGNSEWLLPRSLQRRHREVDGRLGPVRSHWKKKGSVSWPELRRNVLVWARASRLPPVLLQVRRRPSRGRE